jgi:hypothetical protein
LRKERHEQSDEGAEDASRSDHESLVGMRRRDGNLGRVQDSRVRLLHALLHRDFLHARQGILVNQLACIGLALKLFQFD